MNQINKNLKDIYNLWRVLFKKKKDRTEKLAPPVNLLATKPNGLSLIHGIQKVEGENQLL